MGSVLIDVLREEEARLEQNIKIYNKKIDKYPKGSLIVKKRKNHVVYYLNYRDGKKVISVYVKLKDLEQVKKEIAKRNIIRTQVKNLEDEKKVLKIILKNRRSKING